MTTIKDIITKNEAVLDNLKGLAARSLLQMEIKERGILAESNKVSNSDLDMARMVKDFVEWNKNTLLIQAQRINAHVKYKNDLVQFMINKIKADEKVAELEEEIAIKEEDVERLTEDNKTLVARVNELEEEARKLGIISNMKSKRCMECGVAISPKSASQKFCEICSRKSKKEADKQIKEKIKAQRIKQVERLQKIKQKVKEEKEKIDKELEEEDNEEDAITDENEGDEQNDEQEETEEQNGGHLLGEDKS